MIDATTKMDDFRNRLRVLIGIDCFELVAAGVITDDSDGDVKWERFRDNPHRWFIACNDDEAVKLWSIIERRAALPQERS